VHPNSGAEEKVQVDQSVVQPEAPAFGYWRQLVSTKIVNIELACMTKAYFQGRHLEFQDVAKLTKEAKTAQERNGG
jgi:hypothetical protein